MSDDNWTDYERPCFEDYDADPMAMTKEQFVAEAANVLQCCDRDDPGECAHLTSGGTWATCPEGALSSHCPESLRPQGRGK